MLIRTRNARRDAATALLVLLALSSIAQAQGVLTTTPTLWTRFGVNDNRRLTDPDAPTLVESTSEAELDSEYREETWALTLVPRVRVTRHSREKVLDTEDRFVAVGGEKSFERSRIFLDFDYESEGTATTELTDSGIFDRNVTRTTLGGNASWTFDLGEALSANMFGGYTEVSYGSGDGQGLRFFDYDQANGGVGFRYAFSSQTVWVGDATISHFRTPQIRSETRSYAFRAGFEHNFTETVQASVRVGHNISRIAVEQTVQVFLPAPPFIAFQDVTAREQGGGQLVNVSVSKRFERAGISAFWDRYFSPSSQGGRQQRQESGGRWIYRFSPRWRVDMDVVYRQYAQEGSLGTQVRAIDFISTMARTSYRLSEHWSLDLAYRFRHQQEDTTDYSARSNEVFMSVRYSGESFHYSF